MAIITKIRERAGWSIGIIAVALGMFVVGGDLLSSSSWLLGNNKRIVGTINGEDIELEKFEQEYKQLLDRYQQFTGLSPSEDLVRNLREQTWSGLISKYVYDKECKDLGILVTDEELVDMIQGNNIDPTFANNFKDSTGQVDKNLIKRYLANIPQDQKLRYALFEQDLKRNRLQLKYRNLFLYSRLFTTSEMQKEYLLRNSSANISYFYLPYYNIPDSLTAPITDEEAEDYYEDHIEQYRTEPTRQIEYLFFKKEPSVADIKDLKREMETIKISFQETENDSNFIVRNNEIDLIPIDTFTINDLQDDLIYNDLEIGQVYGPVITQNRIFKLYKVLGTSPDTTYSARALSIVFNYLGKNEVEKQQLKKQADSLLQVLKAGADFKNLGQKYNYIDLGWRSEGRIQTELNDAIFKVQQAGLIPKVITTSQNYHLIFVTHPKQTKRWTLAQMGIRSIPSDETIDSIFRKISIFYPEDGNYEALKNNLDDYKINTGDSSLFLIQASIESPNSLNINNLFGSDIRSVFHWIYNDNTDEDDVSDIFDLNEGFMLVALKSKNDSEYRSFESVINEIKRILKNKTKQNYLKNVFKTKPESLDALKSQYPAGNLYQNQTIQLNNFNLDNVPNAVELVASISNLEQGDISAPLFTTNGGLVFLKINMIDKAIISPTQNYDLFHQSLRREVLAQYLDLTLNLDEIVDIEKRLYLYY